MEEEAIKRLQPAAYYRSFLQQGLRPDGREPTTRRILDVQSGVYLHETVGSAIVKLG